MNNPLVPLFAHPKCPCLNTLNIIRPTTLSQCANSSYSKQFGVNCGSQIHPCQNGFLLHENNPKHNTTFNFSQTKWSPWHPLLPSVVRTLRWIPEPQHTCSYVSLLSENLWPCAGVFFCHKFSAPVPACSSGAGLWSSRLLSLTAPGHGWGCNIPSLSRGCTPKLRHYLFTDSSRLIWKRVVKKWWVLTVT